jgi:glycosyltransferase involved in cell wall biosynthesis
MTKPLNIFYVIGYFQPERGYEEFYSAINLAKIGQNVTVITSDRIAPFRGLSKDERKRRKGLSRINGIKLIRLPSIELYTDMIFVFGIFKLLITKKPDVVHCHTTMQFPALLTPLFCKILNIKCVIDCHEFNYVGFPLNPITKGIKSKFVKIEYKYFRTLLAKLALLFSDKIISVAPVCTYFLIDYFKVKSNKIIELNLCVDTSIYKKNETSRSNIRKKFNITDDKILFIFSGLLSERKKAVDYIEIFKKLPDNFCLLYVVSGAEFEINSLNEIISRAGLNKRIFIQTGVDSKGIIEYYSASDLGIWLFNNSVSFLEAMSCSLPVCISNMQLSYLTDTKHSFILDSNNNNEMYISDIINLNIDVLDLKCYGNMSRKYIEENYSYNAYSQKLLNIYYQVI